MDHVAFEILYGGIKGGCPGHFERSVPSLIELGILDGLLEKAFLRRRGVVERMRPLAAAFVGTVTKGCTHWD